MRRFMNAFSSRARRMNETYEIAPDEIFLDASNLPNFNTYQFEGRLEKPIAKRKIFFASMVFFCLCVLLLARSWFLQVERGEAYVMLSKNNSLRNTVIFAPRGLIFDRNGVSLVANTANEDHPDYPSREYSVGEGFAHLLGYVEYPKQDAFGMYFRTEFSGIEGVESYYNSLLSGKNGIKITEENVLGEVESESTVELPRYGANMTLSIDVSLQRKFYELMKDLSRTNGFRGGAAVLMDVSNGEVLALTSYPEFNSTVMSEGADTETIARYLSDDRELFLDRGVVGLYTPGSIVKPFIAVGALAEGVIEPEKKILSPGSISLPNPFNPNKRSVFNDWKAHGWVNMREAIAVSSDVYFYEIGGGYNDQAGLGIGNIKKYLELFGFGKITPNGFLLGTAGTIPDPKWKAETFDGEIWRIGDTYNSSIGQYGMQVTPLQVVRATAALANGGTLLDPTVLFLGDRGQVSAKPIGISDEYLSVARSGMRDAVLFGTATGLNIPQVSIAAKTGTAELGKKKEFVNSWVEGFFPYENPRFAFVVLMEKGPYHNSVGALYVMRQFFDWLSSEAPEYLKVKM